MSEPNKKNQKKMSKLDKMRRALGNTDEVMEPIGRASTVSYIEPNPTDHPEEEDTSMSTEVSLSLVFSS
jgi:hypothetical protein